MITEIEVSGFKSLRNVKIPLSPGITVLVGANNSGKSNALSVFRYLQLLTQSHDSGDALDAIGGFERVVSRASNGLSCAVTSNILGSTIRYEITRTRRGQSPYPATREILALSAGGDSRHTWMATDDLKLFPVEQGHEVVDVRAGCLLREFRWQEASEVVKSFFQELSNFSIFDFSIPALRAESKLQADAALASNGLNLAAVVDQLLNTRPDLHAAVEREIGHPVTNIKRVLAPSGSTAGTKVIGVQEQNDPNVYTTDQISDGLLLFIATSVATQMAGATSSVIAIEAPERGIHPRRIRDMVDQFRRVTAKGTQVVLTTHSTTLLDEFRDFPESVLIFDRDEAGTHVTRLSDHPVWDDALTRDIALGDVWYSGLIGGVPK